MHTELRKAIELLQANGYRVTKPRAKQVKKNRVGPTCVVEWADGEITRMSTFTGDDAPDFARGIKLNAIAWQTAKRSPIGKRLGELAAGACNFDKPATDAERKAGFEERDQLLEIWTNYRPAPLPAIRDCYFTRDGEVIAVHPDFAREERQAA